MAQREGWFAPRICATSTALSSCGRWKTTDNQRHANLGGPAGMSQINEFHMSRWRDLQAQSIKFLRAGDIVSDEVIGSDHDWRRRKRQPIGGGKVGAE